jgi:hypothetical protein
MGVEGVEEVEEVEEVERVVYPFYLLHLSSDFCTDVPWNVSTFDFFTT